jgi:TonB family protein
VTVVMDGRMRDLISTADRQLASKSYDAAIDSYRTALGQIADDAAALRADIEGRLEAAIRAREASQRVAGLLREARYHETAGRLTEAFAAVSEVLALEPLNAAASELRARLLESMPELVAMQRAAPPPVQAVEVAPVETPGPRKVETVEPPVVQQVEPAPPPPKWAFRTIEPPSFHLIEDDPSMLQRPRRSKYIDGPPLSILDPTPLPVEPNCSRLAVIPIVIGVGVVVLAGIATSYKGNQHVNRFTPPVAAYSPSHTEDQAYEVGNGVTAPVLIHQEQPGYTEAARDAQIQGTVVLYVEVERDGTPTVQAVLQSLNKELDRLAMESVRKWRFQPGTLDGRPVKVWTKVDVNFQLP